MLTNLTDYDRIVLLALGSLRREIDEAEQYTVNHLNQTITEQNKVNQPVQEQPKVKEQSKIKEETKTKGN